MSQEFLTLEREAGGGSGGGTSVYQTPEEKIPAPSDEGIDARWRRYQRQADTFFDNRYMATIPSEVVRAHPEGGCAEMMPIPGHPEEAVYVAYNPEQGFYCWGAKRPSLYEREADTPAGANIFQALYGMLIPKSVVGTHLPPAYIPAPLAPEGLGMYPSEMNSLQIRETQQLEEYFYDDGELSGIWKNIKRMVTPPRSVRRWVKRVTRPHKSIRPFATKLGRFGKKGLRYYGATMLTWGTGGFLPASTRNRMFGLKGQEARRFETGAKITRAVSIAAATVVTGGAAMAALSGGGAVGAGGVVAAGSPGFIGPLTAAQTVAAAGKGAWIAKVGGAVLGIAKSSAGQLAVKMLAPGQAPPEAAQMAEGEILGYDPSYDMMGGGLINQMPASTAGMPGITDTSFDDPSATDVVAELPFKKKPAPSLVPAALLGLGAVAIFLTMRRT